MGDQLDYIHHFCIKNSYSNSSRVNEDSEFNGKTIRGKTGVR